LFRLAQLCKVQVYLEEGVLQNILRIVVTDHHAPDMPIERFLVQPYSQRTQRKQRCAFTKNNVRLWDFGTLNETDEERTCLLGGGAGRSPIDRVIVGIEGAKEGYFTS